MTAAKGEEVLPYPVIVNQKGENAAPIYCSFCGKRDNEVPYIVKGPTVFICNECVGLCADICTGNGAPVPMEPDTRASAPVQSAAAADRAKLGGFADGFAAGIEAAAKVCEKEMARLRAEALQSYGETKYKKNYAAEWCEWLSGAIRALTAPASSEGEG